ncbi:VMAP-C domain-containing protein [Streptomyces anulatus]
MLLSFQKMPRLEFRQSVLGEMGQNAASMQIGSDVCESAEPRAHVTEILRTIASRADPLGALDSLRGALRSQAPSDGALPWLELTVLGLTRPMQPLSTKDLLTLIEMLRGVSPAPRPAELSRYLSSGGTSHAFFTGHETLPEVLVRLLDRRGNQGPGPMLRFLRAFTSDAESPLCLELAALRGFLSQWDTPDGLWDTGADQATETSRLIIQIRLEAEDPAHIDNGHYCLQGAYYRQPLPGGPLRRIGTLGRSESFAKGDLVRAGSDRLADWSELASELRSSDNTPVRVEFLLPSSLLGHAAELWSPGTAKRPLGHHHPVVVRSLERYTDAWLDTEPWRKRWSHLQAEGPDLDSLSRIGWLSQALDETTELAQWLVARPTLACLGLDVPYDGLDADLRDAVDDAMFTDGVPVLLWRRNPGDHSELMDALREYNPQRLTDLPEAVHHCRKHGRYADDEDVRNNITLLWDDPYCVDPDQDSPYVGMA